MRGLIRNLDFPVILCHLHLLFEYQISNTQIRDGVVSNHQQILSSDKINFFRKANQFESKHDFKLYTQWTDNYVCDEVSSDELWCELISLARSLLGTSGASEETEAAGIWENLPVSHWR